MDLQLAGKRAIVTGGSRGIGKAIARALALEGVDVAIAARGVDALRATADELAQETGRTIVPVAVDTSSDESVRGMVNEAIRALGGVDILVNSAAQAGGQGPVPKLAEVNDDVFWPDVNVKVMGYIRCIREVAPHMVGNGWGRIINISGLAARQVGGSMVGSIRNVSVAAMTKSVADELGPSGVNCTVVHPGLTRTEATPGVLARRAAAAGVSLQEIESQMARSNSVQRIIDARDIAAVVTFLASPLSIAINGDAVAAGGGTPRAIYY